MCPVLLAVRAREISRLLLLGKVQKQIETNITCWWYTYPSEKYEFVSWDDYYDYSQYMEK
jgi:hypothetical protein